MLDQNPAHRLGGCKVEMSPIRPRDFLSAHETQIGFVNQGGCLEGMAGALFGHPLPSDGAELFVHERQQLVRSASVARFYSGQNARNFTHHIAVPRLDVRPPGHRSPTPDRRSLAEAWLRGRWWVFVLSTPARVHGRRFLENSLPRLVRSAFRHAHIAEPCLDSIDKASHQRRELRIVDGEAVEVAKLASKDVHRDADHGIDKTSILRSGRAGGLGVTLRSLHV